jgi:hypothetical protein
MKNLTAVLGNLVLGTAIILSSVSCVSVPKGYREVTIREDGIIDYILLRDVFNTDYVPIETPEKNSFR